MNIIRLTGFCLIALFGSLACSGEESTQDPPEEVVILLPDPDMETEDADASPPMGPCLHTEDGVCDEPINCPLGTDEVDCAAACDDPANLWRIGAACAHRGLVASATERAPEGPVGPPRGDVRTTGYTDHVIEVPSGDTPNTTALRHWRVFVPPTYDPRRAYPLIINMPGHRVGHDILANYTQLGRSADLNDFIVVYAEQEFRSIFKNNVRAGPWAWWTDWDWEAEAADNPDFTFLRAIIERVGQDYHLDTRRVVLSGHSRGAAMALIAALEMPEVIAGAVVQSGFTEFGYLDTLTGASAPERKVPLVFIHGIQDDDVCIDCATGGVCGVNPQRRCGSNASDRLVERLGELGWVEGEDLVYYRLANVAHRWQTQLNQQWWDFLSARPLPDQGGSP